MPDDRSLFKQQAKDADVVQKKYMYWVKWTKSRYTPSNTPQKEFLRRIVLFFIHKPALLLVDYYYQQFEKICARYNKIDTKLIGGLSVFHFREKDIKYREDYEEAKYVDFEFVKMPVPVRYDHALRTYFGDYMVMKEIPSNHGGVLLDPNISFKEYLK